MDNDFIANLKIIAKLDEQQLKTTIQETQRQVKNLQDWIKRNPGSWELQVKEEELTKLQATLKKQQLQLQKIQTQNNNKILKAEQQLQDASVKAQADAQKEKIANVKATNKQLLAENKEYYSQLLKIQKLESQGNLSDKDSQVLQKTKAGIYRSLGTNVRTINSSKDTSAISQQKMYAQTYQTQKAIEESQKNQQKNIQLIKDAYNDVLLILKQISANEKEIEQLESKTRLNKEEKERLTTLKQQTGELQEQYSEKMKIVSQDANLQKRVEQVTKEYQQQNKELQEQNNRLSTTTKHSKSLMDTIKNIGRYVVMYQALNAIQTGVQKAYETISELDKAFTDIQLVTGDTDEEINQLSQDYNDLAKQMGATTQEVAEGASEWFNESRDHVKVLELLETP